MKKILATGVGSLPHTDSRKACQFILDNFKDDIIFWPQLVKRSFFENMYVQFSQGLPGVVIEKEKQKIYMDTSGRNFLSEMEDCLHAYLNSDKDYFRISKDYAEGFYEMLELISSDAKYRNIEYFKGQIIGPISFGLTVKDENSRPLFYNREWQEMITKSLALKAKWQIGEIKNTLPKAHVIIFIDEPYLVSVGSSYTNLKKEDVVSQINEVAEAIHQENGLAGIHCCGNTDWGLVLESKIDILNFDAYNFLDTVILYQNQLKEFLKRGGFLAWGIVPTLNEADINAIKSSLVNKILKTGQEKDILKNQIIITPSCGCGTLSIELAEGIHRLAVELSHELNDK